MWPEPGIADTEDDPPLDPLSDLLFGLVAIIIPAVAVMLPLIRAAADAVPERNDKAAISFLPRDMSVDGAPAAAFFAGGAGLRIQGDGDRVVSLDRMLDDRPLALELERLRDSGRPLLLLIEPDGQEAAFLFESILAAHGPKRIFQVRLDSACAFLRNRNLFAQCISATIVGGGRL